MQEPSKEAERVPELDGLRAVAIALVIGCHYKAFAASLDRLPEFGWFGVEIFFVLSGYLITTNLLALRGRPGAYRVFYSRRIRRIFPPYFLILAACTLVFAAFTARFNTQLILLQSGFLTAFVRSGTVLSSAVLAFRTHSCPPLLQRSSLLPLSPPGVELRTLHDALGATWSLSVEEWFYILWAPVVLAFGRKGIAAASVPAFVAGFVLRWINGTKGLVWYEDFFCRFDLLALGALLAIWLGFRNGAKISIQRQGDRIVGILGVLGLTGLTAMLLYIQPIVGREIRDSSLFAAFGTICVGLISTCVISFLVLKTRGLSPFKWILRSKPLVWIGRRSYMIYLAHLPWYWIVCAMLGTTTRSSWTSAILSLVLTLATAALSWEYIERPLLRT